MIAHLGYPRKGQYIGHQHMSFLRDNYSFNIHILIDHQPCVMVLDPENKIMKTDKKSSRPHAAYDLVGE